MAQEQPHKMVTHSQFFLIYLFDLFLFNIFQSMIPKEKVRSKLSIIAVKCPEPVGENAMGC